MILTPRENTSVTNITGTPSIVVPTGFAIPQNQGRGGPGAIVAGSAASASAPRSDTGRGAPPAPSQPVSTIPLPTTIYMMGPIYQDEKILAVAHGFQQATNFHLKRPPLFV